MSPEKHLAAILTAWHETNGFHISFELKDALEEAEKDFDGVEIEIDNDQEITFKDPRIAYGPDYPSAKLKMYIDGKWVTLTPENFDFNTYTFRREVRPDDRTE